MNIWHYRDNRNTWLYYLDGRIFIIYRTALNQSEVIKRKVIGE